MENKKLYIDKEALATLSLLNEGLLYPVEKLMNEEEGKEVNKTKIYKGVTFPFAFILAPNGKRNQEVLQSLEKGEKVLLICDHEERGFIICDEVYKIDRDERIRLIYGTNNYLHPGVVNTYKRMGDYAICGEIEINFLDIRDHKIQIQEAIQNVEAKKITAMTISGKPFHRVHERLIRTALVQTDLLVLFLLKPYKNDELSFETRYNCIEYFCNNYLPRERVIIVPLENTYIFGGFNEILLNALVAKNYGCTKLLMGKEKAGLGAYYDNKCFSSILDEIHGIEIDIDIVSSFVYCEMCTTLVSTDACPHGAHHHIHYHSPTIMELFQLGIIPPAILMRKDISAMVLGSMYPNRDDILEKIYQKIFPNSGLIDEFKTNTFYESLMELYQTSSLT